MKASKFLVALMSVSLLSFMMISCEKKNKPDDSDDDTRKEIKLSFDMNRGDMVKLDTLSALQPYKAVWEDYEIKIADKSILSFVNDAISAVGFGKTTITATPNEELEAWASSKVAPNIKITVNVGSDFLMYVEDVFNVLDRGIVVTGTVLKDKVFTGQSVYIANLPDSLGVIKSTVEGIEMFHKTLDEAQAGDNVGILLGSNVATKDMVAIGAALYTEEKDVIRTKEVSGQTTVYTVEEGGRANTGFTIGGATYQLYFATKDATARLMELPGWGESRINNGDVSASVWRLEGENTATVYHGMEVPIRSQGYTLGKLVVE